MCKFRSFLASMFFVVQLSTLLLVPSCSADSISSTTYRYIDHHKRHFNQNHQTETSIISSKEHYRKDISSEMPRIGHDIQEKYITNVNEETSAKQVVAASVNTQQFSNQISSTIITSKNTMLRVQRQLDVEDIFNEMARKDPSQWSAVDWVVLVMFLTMLCWVYSCLCALCCCGRGRRGGGSGSTLLNWLCFYEICCRDGRDLDVCCDYANAAIV